MRIATITILLSLGLVACGEDENEHPGVRDAAYDMRMWSPRVPDAGPSIPASGFEYAMVASLRGVNSIGREDAPPETSHPGADIDAIELRTIEGESWFASAVPMSKEMIGDPVDVMGAPDGCDGYVSLGESGAIRVTFGRPIRPGDSIIVHELDSCGDSEAIGTKLESYYVLVGVNMMPEDATMIGPRGGSEGPGTFPVEL